MDPQETVAPEEIAEPALPEEKLIKRPRGRPKGSVKKVVETPVAPEALPEEEPAPPEPAPPEPAPAKKKPRAKKAPGLSEKLPKRTPNELPADLAPVSLTPDPVTPPSAPALERWRPSREEVHEMFHDYLRVDHRRSSRDARIGLYREWLAT